MRIFKKLKLFLVIKMLDYELAKFYRINQMEKEKL